MLFSCRFLAVEEHEVNSDKYERNTEPLSHIQRHCPFKIHLVFFQELDEEAEYEYFCQAKAEEEAAVIRRIRALSGFIGFKGSVDGCLSQLCKFAAQP